MISKTRQVVLGVLLVLLAILLFFVIKSNGESTVQTTTKTDAQEQEIAKPVAVPLTADEATEQKLLSEKQQQRQHQEQQLINQENQRLIAQDKARELAHDKAEQEAIKAANAAQGRTSSISADAASQSEAIAMPVVQTRPEAIEAARLAEEKRQAEQKAAEQKKAEQKAAEQNKQVEQKAAEQKIAEQKKQAEQKAAEQIAAEQKRQAEQSQKTTAKSHKVVSGDSLTKLAHQYGVSVSAIAAANNMSRDDALQLGRTIKIPSAGQASAKAGQPTKKDNQPKKDTQAKSDHKTPSKSSATYSVQVALSPDKAKIDELVKKYRAAGYKVSTSQTDRGTRVLIGSENSYDDANAIRRKLAQDSRVDAKDAWIKKTEK